MRRFTVFLPLPMIEKLRTRAKQEGYTVAEMIRHLIARALLDGDKQ